MKIIFFGSAAFILPVIETLHKNFSLSLVITTERNANASVPTFCKENKIPFIAVTNVSESLNRIKAEQAELGVLASFGLLLPKEILDIFPKGIINIHPSLLPQYRGAIPVQTALLNGDNQTGVSIIKLDGELDHGPLLAQETAKIEETDTTATLHERLFTQGAEMLKNILPEYLANKVSLDEQKHDQATFTKQSLSRQDGFIDASNPPDKAKLDRMIRAYYPWPGVWTKVRIKNQESRIKLLPKNMIQMEGKKLITLKDFINGYPQLKDTMEKILGPLDS